MDVQVKRIHEYKRQLLNLLSIVHRYNKIKNMSPAERKQVSCQTAALLLSLGLHATTPVPANASALLCQQSAVLYIMCLLKFMYATQDMML